MRSDDHAHLAGLRDATTAALADAIWRIVQDAGENHSGKRLGSARPLGRRAVGTVVSGAVAAGVSA